MEKVKWVVLGLGRMGQIHAQNIVLHPQAELVGVVDQDNQRAQTAAQHFQCKAWDSESVWSECQFDAVLIATPTPTHFTFIQKAVTHHKAIFCEKPIDLETKRAKEVMYIKTDKPFMLGFNRRFDPQFQQLALRLKAGDIGRLHTLQIISRDPALPSLSYLAESGGLFKDMMIHDFDTACWLLEETPVSIYAAGSWMHPKKGIQDVDTAMVTMQTASGRLCHISNNRQTGYGYDQRIEAFGDLGQLTVNNVNTDTLVYLNAQAVQHSKPLHFFTERYQKAYQLALAAFMTCILEGKPSPVDAKAGWQALMLAELAQRSLDSGEAISCEGIFQ